MKTTKPATKTATPLSSHDLRDLRGKLHHLKPTVIVGDNGLTDAVIAEIDRALSDHELIKIRAHVDNSEELVTIADTICSKTTAVLVQIIGHIVAIYRKNPQTEEA